MAETFFFSLKTATGCCQCQPTNGARGLGAGEPGHPGTVAFLAAGKVWRRTLEMQEQGCVHTSSVYCPLQSCCMKLKDILRVWVQDSLCTKRTVRLLGNPHFQIYLTEPCPICLDCPQSVGPCGPHAQWPPHFTELIYGKGWLGSKAPPENRSRAGPLL